MATGRNQYSKTAVTDFYLDIAKLPTAAALSKGQKLETHIVTARQQYRPDLLSFDLYGNSNYWWTIVLLNRDTLKDPIRDLTTGTVLRIIPARAIAGVV